MTGITPRTTITQPEAAHLRRREGIEVAIEIGTVKDTDHLDWTIEVLKEDHARRDRHTMEVHQAEK